MKRILKFAWLFLLAAPLFAQPSNPAIQTVGSDPTGNACGAGVPMLYHAGVYYGCDNTGHYAVLGGGGSGTVPTMPASGDTTGVADTAACNALTTAGTSFMFGAGPYYMSTCNVPSSMSITGIANFISVIHEVSATAYLWNISANGVTIRDLYMDTKIGVTQSAGGVFKVTNSTPIGSIYIQNNVATGAWWSGFKVGPNVLDSYFQNNHYGTTVTAGDGAIYLNNPPPYGDIWFNDNYLYSVPGIQLNACDRNVFAHDKILTGNVKFLQGGACHNQSFDDVSIENQDAAHGILCGYDFGSGGGQPTGTAINGGEIGVGTSAFCNFWNNGVGFGMGFTNLRLLDLTNEVDGIYAYGQNPYVNPVYDSFNGTGGTNLSAHMTDTGRSWLQTFISVWAGNMVLAGTNQVNLSTGAIAAYYVNQVMASPDYSVTVGCTQGAVTGGACVALGRLQSPSSSTLAAYGCFLSQGTGVALYSIAGGGTLTQIGTTYVGGLTGTHTIGLNMVGTAISCTLDGSPVAGPSGTDATYTTAGYSGLAFDNGATTGYFIDAPFTAH